MLRRHADIDDHEIGLLIADDAQQLFRVAGLTRDLEPCALEKARNALTQQDIVVMSVAIKPDGPLPRQPRAAA
jgi:hypothetical protein